MYSRNYYQEEKEFKIPEKYSGTALFEENDAEKATQPSRIEHPSKAEPKFSPPPPDDETNEGTSEDTCEVAQSPPKFDITSLFSSSFPSIKSLIPKIGAEEILLLTLAAFLFFSKHGDKECAAILLLLIFI